MFVIVGMLVIVGMFVIVRFLIQNHIKISGHNPHFIHPADFQGISVHLQAVKGMAQLFLTGTQIQQGRHRHIPADTGIALQIQGFHYIVSSLFAMHTSRLIWAAW